MYTWLFTSQILTRESVVPVPRMRPSGWKAADVYPPEEPEESTTYTTQIINCQFRTYVGNTVVVKLKPISFRR